MATSAKLGDFLEITKPRLNFLVVATAAAGYYLGAGADASWSAGLVAVAGTALVSGGSLAMNQIYERDTDRLMERTRLRPMPDGRLGTLEAGVFAMALTLTGLLALAVGNNALAMLVALVTSLTYVLVYTPLKRRTSLATVIGAIPGALPPMIGWAAAADALPREAWLLFAIVFLWQMPHFLAIAWLYREDYARAGFPLLPVTEPDGRSTGRAVLAYGAALLPVSLVPTLVGLTTSFYFVGAFVLGAAYLLLGAQFALRRRRVDAMRLFIGSIIYLPLVWSLMILTRA